MRPYDATKPDLITKVNVTPIIDVALVLVIILLVTAPMLSVADLPVNLPAAHTREAEEERNVSVTIATTGELAVDDQRVTAEQLRPKLVELLARPGNDGVLVVVRADSGTPFRTVRLALDDARAAGAKRLAIATRQVGKEERR
jgi:biopolymer transport protein TolR